MRLLFRLIRNVLVNVLYALRWPFVVSRRGSTDFVRIELDGPLPLRHEPRGVPFFLRRFFAPGPRDRKSVV